MIENLKCPNCYGPMTSRANGSSGQRFWGCNRYPMCRGTRNTDGEAPGTRPASSPPAGAQPELPSDLAKQNDRARWRDR